MAAHPPCLSIYGMCATPPSCSVWSLHMSERFQPRCARFGDVSPCQHAFGVAGESEQWLDVPLVWPSS